MTSRERFHATMHYRPVDHPVFAMPWFGFEETFERWKREGFREESLDDYPVDKWNRVSGWFFPHPPFENTIVEETDEYILHINHEGILMREFKDHPDRSMPQFVRFPVQTREDFRAFARERFQPDLAARIGPRWAEDLKAMRDAETVLWIIADRWGGFFGPLRNLVGVEELCMLFYTDPVFVEEMMDVIADFMIAVIGQILDHITIDAFGFWEDMAYNHGPLIGPELVRKYMLPRYRRVAEYARGRGVEWISLDSDGRVDLLVPVWLEAGINFIYPFEIAAGMDVVEMRRRYGRGLRMYMGMDKRALAEGRRAIDAEIDRVMPLIEEGGYIAAPDHSLPPDIPYANFRYYMDEMARRLGV